MPDEFAALYKVHLLRKLIAFILPAVTAFWAPALGGDSFVLTKIPLRSVSQIKSGAPGGGGGARIQAVAWAEHEPFRVVLGTGCNGVWFSIDGGACFEPAEGFILPDVKALSFSPWTEGVVYCLASAKDVASLSVARKEGLWRSRNGGKSWQFVVRVPLEEDEFGRLIAFSESGGKRLVVAGSHGRGLLISGNGGDSWRWKQPGNGEWIAGVVAVGSIIVAATDAGLFRSEDGGETFSHVDSLERVGFTKTRGDVLSLGAGQPPKIYLAWSGKGLYASEDLGASWRLLGERKLFPERYFSAVYASGRHGDPLFSMIRPESKEFGKLPLRSLDGGVTWKEPERIFRAGRFTGPSVFAPESLAFHPAVSGIALAGIDRELMRTTDGGLKWKPWGSGLFAWTFGSSFFAARAPLAARRFWIALGAAGLWFTGSGGTSFRLVVKAEGDCVAVASSPDPELKLLLSWWERRGLLTLRQSSDRGRSWKTVLEDVETRPSLIFDPLNAKTVYAGRYRYEMPENGSGKWQELSLEAVSVSGGEEGVVYGIEPDKPYRLMCLRKGKKKQVGPRIGVAPTCACKVPGESGALLVGTEAGLFLLEEGNWKRCSPRAAGKSPLSKLKITSVLSDLENPKLVFASARWPWKRRGGIMFSTDCGASWSFQPVRFPVTGLVQFKRGSLLAATDAGLYWVELEL